MTMTDPLGDMLTRIRNGASRRKNSVTTPASRLLLVFWTFCRLKATSAATPRPISATASPRLKSN